MTSNANRQVAGLASMYKQVTVVPLTYADDYSLGILSSRKCRINTKIQISDFKQFRFFLVGKLYGEAYGVSYLGTHTFAISNIKDTTLRKKKGFVFFF